MRRGEKRILRHRQQQWPSSPSSFSNPLLFLPQPPPPLPTMIHDPSTFSTIHGLLTQVGGSDFVVMEEFNGAGGREEEGRRKGLVYGIKLEVMMTHPFEGCSSALWVEVIAIFIIAFLVTTLISEHQSVSTY
ncbi:transmembrane protein, putative [Medicago truncatula]|uniref:Transmembrane protein, putative n=1 Tax=Medicago truncatula TaxID=3880 RepID=G7L834_MEDTR|nr:transmembrane protein, putative [Medicago truncatula]